MGTQDKRVCVLMEVERCMYHVVNFVLDGVDYNNLAFIERRGGRR